MEKKLINVYCLPHKEVDLHISYSELLIPVNFYINIIIYSIISPIANSGQTEESNEYIQ